MKNLYKETNYSPAPALPIDESFYAPVSVSDAIYDAHRNISHAFVPVRLPNGTEIKRLVGDVELCMSTDPSVRSVVSPEYQRLLREGLLNQPRSGKQSESRGDDEIASHVIPDGLERDEIAELIKQGLDIVSSSGQLSPNDVPHEAQPSVEPASESASSAN